MLVKSTVRAFALLSGSVFMLATASLQAAVSHSQVISIPFAFHVQKQNAPAGQYRVEQSSSSEVATLVNLSTGHRYIFLRPTNIRREGKAKLEFANVADGVELKKIS